MPHPNANTHTSEWLSGQTWVRAESRWVVAAQQQKAASATPPGTRPARGTVQRPWPGAFAAVQIVQGGHHARGSKGCGAATLQQRRRQVPHREACTNARCLPCKAPAPAHAGRPSNCETWLPRHSPQLASAASASRAAPGTAWLQKLMRSYGSWNMPGGLGVVGGLRVRERRKVPGNQGVQASHRRASSLQSVCACREVCAALGGCRNARHATGMASRRLDGWRPSGLWRVLRCLANSRRQRRQAACMPQCTACNAASAHSATRGCGESSLPVRPPACKVRSSQGTEPSIRYKPPGAAQQAPCMQCKLARQRCLRPAGYEPPRGWVMQLPPMLDLVTRVEEAGREQLGGGKRSRGAAPATATATAGTAADAASKPTCLIAA